MKYFLRELGRSFFSRYFLLGIFLTLFCLFIGSLSDFYIFEKENGIAIFFDLLFLSETAILPIVAPFIVALPMSMSFVEDKENYFLNGQLARMNRYKYFFTKIFTTGMMGSMVLMIPLMLGLTTLVLIYNNLVPLDELAITKGVLNNLAKNHSILYSFLIIIHLGVFGFIYSVIGLVASMVVQHKYMALIFPFILYFSPSFIFPFIGVDYIEPVTTFDVLLSYKTTFPLVYGQLFLLFSLALLVGQYVIKKEPQYQ